MLHHKAFTIIFLIHRIKPGLYCYNYKVASFVSQVNVGILSDSMLLLGFKTSKPR